MRQWLPVIAQYYPGSGITVHTILTTQYRWWVLFVAHARKAMEDSNGK